MPASAAVQRPVKQPWAPIPNSSQEFALDTRADETLYHGARGPGKTDCQLMRFYRRVGQGYGQFWRGVIFDREYKNLDDLVSKSKRWFYDFDDGANFLSSSRDYKWVWPTGEELLFRAAEKEDDYWRFHGQEFPFIGWNELCKYPNGKLYDMMMSCNRSSFTVAKDAPGTELPPIPLEVFSTTNPYGPGHTWVKRRFIDPAPSGVTQRIEVEIFNPQTQREEVVTKTRVAIFGSYRENIYLDPKYIANLASERDENKRKAWLKGSWDIVAGGALDDVWKPNIHIIPRFVVPTSWRIDRSFDWGSTHPACCVWFAESDGTEAKLPNGDVFCPKPHSIVGISELYFHDPAETNVGLKLPATKIAEDIRDHEIQLFYEGWIPQQPMPGPADNQIRNVVMSDIDTIETQMGKIGVRWTLSDKSPGSRATGLQLVRDHLQHATDHKTTGDSKGPGLYVTANCRMVIATVPILPRDPDKPDDVDTHAEDHPYDCIRYRVLAGHNRYATSFRFLFPT